MLDFGPKGLWEHCQLFEPATHRFSKVSQVYEVIFEAKVAQNEWHQVNGANLMTKFLLILQSML